MQLICRPGWAFARRPTATATDASSAYGPALDRQRARFQAGEQADLAPQVGFAAQHGLTALQQHPAEGGGRHALGAAVEQRHAEHRFQRGHAARQARLRQVQRLGRTREVAVPANGQCMTDEPQFDDHAPSVSPACASGIGHMQLPMKDCAPLQRAWCATALPNPRTHTDPKEQSMKSRWMQLACGLLAGWLLMVLPAAAQTTAAKPPNILVIWGDDVGIWNIGAYHRGMMGGATPNIDRSADEGMIFMDHYAHASCTAGRAAFITGQYPMRTGLSTVGLPGAPQGLQKEDPTLAELLKPLGYATGQFGKNHLGDRGRAPADRARLRRVLRHPLPPECGRVRRAVRLPEGPGDPEALRLRKQRGVIHCKANADGTQTHRGPGTLRHGAPAHAGPGRADGIAALHPRRGEGGQAVLRLAQHHAHALPHQPVGGST